MTWGEGLLTTGQAAKAAGREPATIRSWVARGWLRAAAGTRARPLYRARDVLDAERDCRRRDVRNTRSA